MLLFQNIKIFFNYCFKTKWIFSYPKKNKFLLFDGQYNPFKKYIKKRNLTILYRRGEEINFIIFLKCIFKLKFQTIDYCKEFIKHVNPKLILTAFDYYTIFYKLSKSTGIKTLMLQKGKRGKSESIFRKSKFFFPPNSKKKFHVDYALLYNNSVKKFYSKRISGNFFITGSFENNFSQLNYNSQKKEVVFISNYSPDEHSRDKRENEDIIAYYLDQFSRNNNIKFNILPRYRLNNYFLNSEIDFYKKIIKNKINFILNKKKTSYKLLLNYKYVFATYSTLALEFFSKGGRTGFIMFKSKKNPILKYKFGDYENLNNRGKFWSTFYELNIKEIKRVFDFVVKSSESSWIHENKIYQKKIMGFDYKNKVFKKIMLKNNLDVK